MLTISHDQPRAFYSHIPSLLHSKCEDERRKTAQKSRRAKTKYCPRLVSLIAFVASVVAIAWVAPVTSMRTHPKSTLNSLGLTDSRGSITVHATGRGNPWINLRDGRDVSTGYTGAAELQQVLEQNLARPLALTSADYDEDGVPDLIVGYAGPSGGIITLHRGNVDSIYPNAPEAQQRKADGTYTDSPFLSPAHVFEVAEAADFVGAGDFDADSHWDVVAAARGGNALWLLPGDGRGSLGAARRIDLPGRVTALVTGEINRADGLTDVVVGVVAADGPKALVFESPEGALRGKPESYGLPAEATPMALGRLDDDYTVDLAVGAGSDLTVVYGRDRKLSLDEIRQAEVPKAKIDQRSFPFAIKSVAVGDFTGDGEEGLSLLSDDGAVHLLSRGEATGREGSDRVENWKSELVAGGPWAQATQLVCARVSSIPVDNPVVVDSADHKLRIIAGSADPRLRASGAQLISLDIEGEPMAVLPMRLNGDALSDLVILRNGQSAPTMAMTQSLATFTVTNTADSGPGSLRQAIFDANANPGLDSISFSIGSGAQTINVGSSTGVALPAITDPVIIDGTTQPGYAGSPLIELNGTSAGLGVGVTGLFITAGSSTIKGLVINRFGGLGIRIITPGGNVIEGNYIGTDVTGTVDLGNNSDGVFVSGALGNTIGGTASGARNVISGNNNNGIGIGGSGATGNLVQGNFIGTDVNGTADLGNTRDGVTIVATNNTIGGTAAGARNIISGNNVTGIGIAGSGATGNLVQGNFIGTDVNSTADLGNTGSGVGIGSATNNTIGGTAANARNVISGNNNNGIDFFAATANVVQGNFIGTDVNGTAALGNAGDGVSISFAANNTIGGTAVGARNVISGNNSDGISISGSSSTGNQVQGNYNGTDVNGTADLGNTADGVFINGAANNTIGGTAAGARNVISGNNGNGIVISGGAATGNQVQGNFIGTDVTGTAALGNGITGSFLNGLGVFVNNAPGNTIGGPTVLARNLISGNVRHGVSIAGASSIGNQLQGNFIGTDSSGTAALGNSRDGVTIGGGSNTTVTRNLISGNGASQGFGGLVVTATPSSGPGTGNVIHGNFVGTNVTGTAGVGNHSFGIALAAPNNSVGGTSVEARNIISGNGAGVIILATSGGATGSGSLVQGNLIGTGADGTSPLGNVGDGVVIFHPPGFVLSNVRIGGASNGAGNVIAFNSQNGVRFGSGVGHSVLSNSIFSNGALGIDLSSSVPPDGITPNDAGDADTGPNNLQNFPVLTSATSSGNNTVVQGTLNSTINTTFNIQFFANPGCDSSGNGEGQTFLGSTSATTDAQGNASFNATLSTLTAAGQVVTATATDPAGNTSEFSQCVEARSAAGQAEFVIEAVTSLVNVGALNEGQANGLISKLEAAQSSLNKGKTAATCNQLQAFINHVNGLISAGILLPTQGQPLIDSATNIRNALSCP